jgi:hypothetical protein
MHNKALYMGGGGGDGNHFEACYFHHKMVIYSNSLRMSVFNTDNPNLT